MGVSSGVESYGVSVLSTLDILGRTLGLGLSLSKALTLRETVCVLVASVRFCDSMNCSPSGPSVREISWARILEWASISPRGSSPPRDQTWVSCTAGRFSTA